jgi:hypothetical protein
MTKSGKISSWRGHVPKSRLSERHVVLIEFHWWRASEEGGSEGYRLAKSPPNKMTPFLPGTDILKVSGVLEPYTPRPSKPIHRTYAGLPDEPKAFLEFAREYGLPTQTTQPESIEALVESRNRLRSVLRAVDEAKTARDPAERENSRRRASRTWTELAQSRLSLELSRSFVSDYESTLELTAKPASLLDYMFLLAADELQGNAVWRACSVCGKPMPLGPGAGRKHRDTCSNTCRQRKHYLKRKEINHASQG